MLVIWADSEPLSYDERKSGKIAEENASMHVSLKTVRYYNQVCLRPFIAE